MVPLISNISEVTMPGGTGHLFATHQVILPVLLLFPSSQPSINMTEI